MNNVYDFTVLMSVYKDELVENFEEAISSIYDVQIIKPAEIIIIQDGPLTEELEIVIQKWFIKLPKVIKIFKLEFNSGLAKALNFGISMSSYDLIARMDSDDISLPNRFSEQIEFFKNNPETSVLSSYIEEFNETMTISLGVRKVPTSHSEIEKFAKIRNPISHPVSIFKKNDVLSVGGYPIFNKAQDYALWCLMIKRGYKFANLSNVHLKMRTGKKMMKRRGFEYLKNEIKIIKFQRKINFISSFQFILNLLVRTFYRIQPNFIKMLLYKSLK